MPPAYRITYEYALNTDGWSESFHTSLTNITAINNLITNYSNARFAFLSRQVQLLNVRVSDDSLFRDIGTRPVVGGRRGAIIGDAASPDVTSVFILASGNLYKRYMYCRGLPRSFNDARNYDSSSAAWAPMEAFKIFLKSSNISIYAQDDPSTAQVVTGYDPANGTFTVGAAIPGLAVGKYITITANRGITLPRGKYRVIYALAGTSFRLWNWPLAVVPTGAAMVRLSDKTMRPVDYANLNDVGERKVGRPFGLRRGRARAR